MELAFDIVELVPCPAPVPTGPLREIAFRADVWLPDDVAALRDLFGEDEGMEEMALRLGRTLHAVRTKVQDLGLRRNSQRPWTELDDEHLTRRYGEDATSAVAQELGRTAAAVYARAGILGLTEGNPPPWTAWEDQQLRAGYSLSVPLAQLAILIGRPFGGLSSRANILGLIHADHPPDWSAEEGARAIALAETGMLYASIRSQMEKEGFPARSKVAFGLFIRKTGYSRGWGRPWTREEDDLLRHLYAQGKAVRATFLRLGRTAGSVRWRVGEIGLQGTHPQPNGFRQGPDWTARDEAFLRQNYGRGKMKTRDIADRLGRGFRAVLIKAHAMKLVHGYGRAWTEDELRALEIGHRHGLALSDLADATGRDVAVIWRKAKQRGLAFGAREKAPPRTARASRRTYSVADILSLEASA